MIPTTTLTAARSLMALRDAYRQQKTFTRPLIKRHTAMVEQEADYDTDTERDSEQEQTGTDLLGGHVSIQVPFEAVPDDCTWIDGEITGVGGPLV